MVGQNTYKCAVAWLLFHGDPPSAFRIDEPHHTGPAVPVVLGAAPAAPPTLLTPQETAIARRERQKAGLGE